MSLQGKVAVVTGSGRGLGLAYAQELARQGAAVVVPRDAAALAREIQDLVTNNRRTGVLRAAARQFANTHLTWQAAVRSLLTLYERLLTMKPAVV